MTSKKYEEAYVWVWLPGEVEPVVAGRFFYGDDRIVFNYGKSYLERKESIPLYLPELPLKSGLIEPPVGFQMANSLRDSSPDAWGRRVIMNRHFGQKGNDVDTTQLDELTYLLESGSDRIGFLDFQSSPTEYKARVQGSASLEDLMNSASKVEKGLPLSDELDQALNHGTSIGGARPKALIESDDKKYIAKFSSSKDLSNMIKSEYVGMRLACLVGIDSANVELTTAGGKDVILVERFDRVRSPKGWQRKGMVSALTLLQLNELFARYASYEDLAEVIRHRFEKPSETLEELYKRLVFNIIVGNTDDHARNHAAFWNGQTLSLSPAYDICPQVRAGQVASQGMLIAGQNNRGQLSLCLDSAKSYLLSRSEAVEIIEVILKSVVNNWTAVCEEAKLSKVERVMLAKNQFFNPYIFEGLESDAKFLSQYREAFSFHPH